MRWKIILVNAVIVAIVGVLSYVLLGASLSDIVANPVERKAEVARALRAANAQLTLDGLRIERWVDEQADDPEVVAVFEAGTASARREAATAQANKLREAAVREPIFAKMVPALVLFVDEQGIALGRNGSAQMRGDKMAEVYPDLGDALKDDARQSSVWINRNRGEQLLVAIAPVHDDAGKVAGAIVVGTPLNDERLTHTSELTSGHPLLMARIAGSALDLVANSATTSADLVSSATGQQVQTAAASAQKSGNATIVEGPLAGHVLGTMPMQGYGTSQPVVLVSAVPASQVGSVAGLLWPILGVTLLGVVLVIGAGWMLGNYFATPISELEDGLLAIINGQSDLRFQMEHPDLGGLVFRINSLLNALMGVPEDDTDDQGRPSQVPTARHFQEALSVDESSVTGKANPETARALADEPADQYYGRLFREYIAAKRQLGDPVDHITEQAFVARIQGSEQEMSAKHGRPVRYQVQVRDGSVALTAIPLPG